MAYRGAVIEQVDFFQSNKIDEKIQKYQEFIQHAGEPYDLVAVNKMYESAIVYDRSEEKLYYVDALRGYLEKTYPAPHTSSHFGPNYYLMDSRFEKYESVQLTNKKRKYTCCAKYELAEYLARGWIVE